MDKDSFNESWMTRDVWMWIEGWAHEASLMLHSRVHPPTQRCGATTEFRLSLPRPPVHGWERGGVARLAALLPEHTQQAALIHAGLRPHSMISFAGKSGVWLLRTLILIGPSGEAADYSSPAWTAGQGSCRSSWMGVKSFEAACLPTTNAFMFEARSLT